MSDPKRSDLNPKTTSYEFLGPPGAFAITIGVPVLTYVLFFTCNESSDGCPPPLQTLYPSLVQAVTDPGFWWKLWDPKAFAIYYSWYAFCLITWAVLPGDWVQGTQLRTGKYQWYKINGTIFASIHKLFDSRQGLSSAFSTCLMALGLSTGYILRFGVGSFTFFYDHWVGLVSAALSMSLFQSILWYALSFQEGKLLALGGNSGNVIYDVRFCHRDLFPLVLMWFYSSTLDGS